MDEWPEEFEMSMYQTEDGSICLWRKVCDENFVRRKGSHFLAFKLITQPLQLLSFIIIYAYTGCPINIAPLPPPQIKL